MKSLDLKKPIKKSTLGAGAVRIKKNIVFSVGAQHAEPLHNDKPMSPVKLSRPRLRLTKKKTIGLAILVAIIVLVASYFIFYYQTQKSQAAEWFNQDWHYRQQFDVYNNSSTEDLLDFQVAIPSSTLGLSTLLTNGKLKSDYTDLRFTDKNGNLLDYWFPDATSTMDTVYVKFSTLTKAATTTVIMYYGNPSAADARNGKAVFPDFFDDFADGNYTDGARHWDVNSGSFSVAGSPDKYLNTVSAGSIQSLSTKAYGTWEFDFNQSGTNNNYTFNFITTGVNQSYGLNIYHEGFYLFMWDGAEHDLFIHTAAVSASTWYRVKINRTLAGMFSVYIKGGAYGTSAWTLLSATGGSNPTAADNTYTTASSYVISSSVAGNIFDNLIYRQFVVTDPTIIATAGTSEEIGGGPIGYWKFDEGYGTTAYDSSSYKNNGTLTNMSTSGTSTAWVDGKVNKALMFDGVNDSVRLTSARSLAITQAWSFSMWQKIPTSQCNNWRGFLGGNLGSGGYWFYHSGCELQFYNDAGYVYQSGLKAGGKIPYDKWFLLTVVSTPVDATHTTFAIYINGKLEKSSAFTWNSSSIIFSYIGMGDVAGAGEPGRIFAGAIDEVKIYNYAISTSQILTEYNRSKSVVSGADNGNKTQGLVGYWKMDESTSTWPGGASSTIFDSSGAGNNGISYNNTHASTTAVYGNAAQFGSSNGDYVQISDTSNLDFGPNDFTVSVWANMSAARNWNGTVVSKWNTGATPGTNEWSLGFGGANAADRYPVIGIEIGNTSYSAQGTTQAATGTWYFLTGVRRGNNIELYVNGSFIKSASVGSGAVNNVGRNLLIGNLYDGGTFDASFNGLIDDAKVYVLARTPDQIMDDYLRGPGPIAYYNFDEGKGTTANDSSGAGHTGTITPGTGGFQQGKIGKAYNFDGTTTYVDTGTDWFGAGALSISGWVNPSVISSRGVIGNGKQFIRAYSSDSGHLNSFWFTGNGSTVAYAGDNALSTSTWVHFVLTRTPTGVANWYINGVLSGTPNQGSGAPQTGTGNVRIGDENTGVSNFKGKIDEVKIYNYALTPWQVAQEYNQGKPIAQWSFEEGQGSTVYNSYPTSTNALVGTLNNMSVTGTSTAWTSGKIGKALMFDGSNDNITAPSNSVLGFGGSDFSISAWVKATALGTTRGFIGKASGLGFGVAGYYMYLGNSGANWCFAVDDATNHTAACDARQRVTAGSWYHVVATWNNSTKNSSLYVNGFLAASSTNTSVGTYTNSNSFYIGGIGTANSANNRFNGQVDEVRAYSYILSPAQVRQDYNDGLAAALSSLDGGQNIQNGLVGWWKMDESTSTWPGGASSTVFDSSGDGYNGTSVGDAKATTTAQYGNAGYFDGTGDYITCGDADSQLIFANRPHTYEAWINAANLPNAYNYVVATGNDSAGQQSGFSVTSAGKLSLSAYSSPIVEFTSATPTIAVGSWYHVAMVYDGTYAKVYINGLFQEKEAIALNTTTGKCRIGAGVQNQTPWTGQIDDVKIYALVRTPDQIMADYLNGPGPIVYYNLDEGKGTTANDVSGNGNTGSITAGTGSFQQGKIGKAYNFDAANTRINTGSDVIGIGPASVSAWIYPKSQGEGGVGYIATNGSFWLYVYNTNRLFYRSDGTSFATSANNALTLNAWNHVVLTRTATGVSNFYINGVISGNANTSVAPITLGTTNVFIGSNSAGGSTFDGKIDEVKIFNYALTPWQVAQEYNGGKPIAYWKLDDGQGGRVSDYSGNGYHGTLVLGGSPATSSAWQASSNCKLNGCLSFDGTDDYACYSTNGTTCATAASGVLDFGTGDFTIGAWVKNSQTLAGTGNLYGIFNKFTSNTSGYSLSLRGGSYNGLLLRIASVDLTPRVSYNSTLSDGNWHYVAARRINGNAYLYIDGAEVGSYIGMTNTIASSNQVEIGVFSTNSHGSFQFNGKIDEVKLYNYALSPIQIKNEYNLGKGIFFK